MSKKSDTAIVQQAALQSTIWRLQMLLGAGIPLTIALQKEALTQTDPRLSELMSQLMASVLRGGTLIDVLSEQSAWLPREVITAVSIGEETGRLEEALAWLDREWARGA